MKHLTPILLKTGLYFPSWGAYQAMGVWRISDLPIMDGV